MDRGRVGEDRESKETDGCPLTEMEKKMGQTKKTTAKTEKRTVEMRQTVEGTRKTAAANKKMEWESLYQNHHNTHQMDSRTILYNLKKKTN
jgi:hypothetical protein